jgi:hypothetical protein
MTINTTYTFSHNPCSFDACVCDVQGFSSSASCLPHCADATAHIWLPGTLTATLSLVLSSDRIPHNQPATTTDGAWPCSPARRGRLRPDARSVATAHDPGLPGFSSAATGRLPAGLFCSSTATPGYLFASPPAILLTAYCTLPLTLCLPPRQTLRPTHLSTDTDSKTCKNAVFKINMGCCLSP